MNEVERQDLRQFLARHDTLSLSTVNPAGHPEAAPVFYAADTSLSIYFVSSPESSHSRNVKAHPTISAVIYQDGQDRRTLQGLQVWGECLAVDESELATARNIYLAKFPFITNDPSIFKIFNSQQLYCIQPKKLRLIDNARGFGYKMEWNVH